MFYGRPLCHGVLKHRLARHDGWPCNAQKLFCLATGRETTSTRVQPPSSCSGAPRRTFAKGGECCFGSHWLGHATCAARVSSARAGEANSQRRAKTIQGMMPEGGNRSSSACDVELCGEHRLPREHIMGESLRSSQTGQTMSKTLMFRIVAKSCNSPARMRGVAAWQPSVQEPFSTKSACGNTTHQTSRPS